MAWAGNKLLIVSDRHGHVIFGCDVDMNQMTIAPPVPAVVIRNEQLLLDDAESLTIRQDGDGTLTVYALCSLSNDRAALAQPKRQHMLRFVLPEDGSFNVGQSTVLDLHSVRMTLDGYFERAGVRPYRTYYQEFAGPDKNTYRWGNVEGMTVIPESSSFLCGMRNPMQHDNAIFFVLEGIDEAFRTRNANRIRVTDMFTLPLGGRGVSDLCWDPLTKGYIIAAATCNGPRLSEDQPWPPNELDSALFWWSGCKSDSPILFATFPDMKIEAVCRLGGSRFIAVGSDEADLSEGRSRTAQSILTIMYFTGIQQIEQESGHE
jgi:hypothetical protein